MYSSEIRRMEAFHRTDKLYIVVWQSYGDWKATSPFATAADAQEHIDRHIGTKEKDYNKLITIVPIDKPKG